MNSFKLFAYGTLLDTHVQLDLFGVIIHWYEKATLQGWKKHTDQEYPYITPEPGHIVEGKIISLDNEQLQRADIWEEVPHAYERIQVMVQTASGSNEQVWVYVKAKIWHTMS